MTIQLLATDVAAKIAAGEVVERPANVAKELLENSLDAGATEIRVEIREGGQRLLRVIDNGHGIPPDEVPLAFERHATSKLQKAEDLNQIATFGFRGEALFSIAAVSQVTLTTRAQSPSEAEGADDADNEKGANDGALQYGVQLRIEGGQIVDQRRTGAPVGTVINIEHLFYNMPARKKFLRKAVTEAGHISSVIQHYALAYPERRFSFVNEGRLIFQSNGRGDLFDVLVKVYGLENAKQMVKIGEWGQTLSQQNSEPGLSDEIDFMGDEAPRHSTINATIRPICVTGYASLPSLTRANRKNIDLFVNRRYVEDRNLSYAIIQAYHTLLPGGRFPIATIFVDLDPSMVDVNVHPQKTQVRFQEDRRVFSAVQKAVRRAIVQSAPVPDMTLAPGAIPPEASQLRTDEWSEIASSSSSTGWSVRRDSIVNAGRQQSLDLYRSPASTSPPIATPPGMRSGVPDAAPDQPANLPIDAASYVDSSPTSMDHETRSDPPVVEQNAEGTIAQVDEPRQTESSREVVVERSRQLPPLRVVGQIGATYIVTEGPEGMFLIDQHAAHERILYEKFMAEKYGGAQNQVPERAENSVARQQLLQPLTLHAGSETAGLVAQHMEELNRIGFDVEPFGGDTFLVRAVPAVLSGQDPLQVIGEIADSLGMQRNLVGEELEARLVKMVCKRAAIKAGQLLSDIEMQELIRQLEACQSPRTCPHGRPTMIQLSAGELEKAFGRV
ncbi:DNA mismatch repair endonuclease MutL [Chloroflexi bacterium TSY]|nr:DNA mismatch repair endonuclease MutL [Chloroflexi bacterium TSY]